MTEPGAYGWMATTVAASITAVEGLDERAIGAAFRLMWDSARMANFSEADEAQVADPEVTLVQLDDVDSWQIVVEPNGFLGSDLSFLETLSSRGRAANLYWNVNMLASFAYASDGRLVRSFDPVLYANGGAGVVLGEEAGLPWGADPLASAGILMERLTGLRLDTAWFSARRRTFETPLVA